MKDKICITLDENHIYTCSNNIIARSGENEITQLEITLAECLCNYWVYLDFVKADGTKFKTPRLDIIGNVVTYDLPNSLLDISGDLKVQIVLQDENGEVWKSTIKTYRVTSSINATDDIPNKEDFITDAQNLLNEIEEGLTPTIGENGNWFINGKDTGKTSRGTQGEKGDKGDAGSVKFIIVTELPTENIDDSAIYMKPSGATNDTNTYEEYIYANEKWEPLGSASVEVDMAGYITSEELDKKLEEAINEHEETDPTVPEHVKNIKEEDIAKWNSGGGATGLIADVLFEGKENKTSIGSKFKEYNYIDVYIQFYDFQIIRIYNDSNYSTVRNINTHQQMTVVTNGENKQVGCTAQRTLTLDSTYTLKIGTNGKLLIPVPDAVFNGSINNGYILKVIGYKGVTPIS